MNARGLMITCLALILASILIAPTSAHFGVRNETASLLSSVILLGGIITAYMTVKKETEA